MSKKEKETIGMRTRWAWALSWAFLGAFVWVTLAEPKSTGLMGYYLVEKGAVFLLGSGVSYFPLFCLAMATVLLIAKPTTLAHSLRLMSGLYVVWLTWLQYQFQGSSMLPIFPVKIEAAGLFGGVMIWILGSLFGANGVLLMMGMATIFILWILFYPFWKLLFQKTVQCLVWLWKMGTDIQYRIQWMKACAEHPIGKHIFFIRRYLDEATIDPNDTIIDVNATAAVPRRKRARKEVLPSANTDIQIIDAESHEHEEIEESPAELPEPSAPVLDSAVPLPDSEYQLPPVNLLEAPHTQGKKDKRLKDEEEQEQAKILEQTLESFKVDARVVSIVSGPSVTRYELEPGKGVKVSKITNLAQDIALKLAATSVRIEAPIPGKALVGIEVPHQNSAGVTIRAILKKRDFLSEAAKLPAAVGLTITGDPTVMALEKMPHVLIAGATGSGKSVCINSIIVSILMKSTPKQVKFLMIDPKKVELSLYNDIPHLLAPVVTNPHKAAATLKEWALKEMEQRYDTFAKIGVKDIEGYNRHVQSTGIVADEPLEPLPYIVVVIDELADLMMVAAQDVETTICRLAQMARATGIHLVVATQRPSVNVVTGLIKANIPSRLAFFVQSQIDSRTILDSGGAEKLLGKGDMLYLPVGALKPQRLQGVFVSEDEVKRVVAHVKSQGQPDYSHEVLNVTPVPEAEEKGAKDGQDELFEEARELIRSTQYASTSYLQRKLRIGYNRAARLIDELEDAGVISAADADGKNRQVIG